jgi:hypothetical protein
MRSVRQRAQRGIREAQRGLTEALASIERLRVIRSKAEALLGGEVHADAERLCRETDVEIAAAQKTVEDWRRIDKDWRKTDEGWRKLYASMN